MSDAAYMKAVRRGDMAEVQRMVDEAAKAASDNFENDLTEADGMPALMQHVTNSDWNSYDMSKGGIDKYNRGSGAAIWLAPYGSPIRSAHGGKVIKKLYAFAKNALVFRDKFDVEAAAKKYGHENLAYESFPYFVLPKTRQNLLDAGYDAVVWNRDRENPPQPHEILVFNPSQIKSADPVTYDDAGCIIPLSQRFKATSEDIRNPRHAPRQFPYEYAKYLKSKFPDIWRAGGNIRGNDAFRWWTAYRRGDRSPTVMRWWTVTRPAWIARHYQDHRLPGVVAQIKWGTVGVLGVAGMKRVVEDAIRRRYAS